MNMYEQIAKLAEAARIIEEVEVDLLICKKDEAACFLSNVRSTIANVADDLETDCALQ